VQLQIALVSSDDVELVRARDANPEGPGGPPGPLGLATV
jgi:hypothetical protein